MKAAVLNEHNNITVDELEMPKELKPGQVKVRIKSATICGAQIAEITGAKGPDKFLPHLLGHEGAGYVVEVGPGVTKVAPDDYVVLHWRKGEGIDAHPATYTRIHKYDNRDVPMRQRIGAGQVTTFSEYAIVSENRLTQINQFKNLIGPEIASLFGCAVTTGFGLINNEAKLKIGQNVLVLGAGGVGFNVIQAAKIAGANMIIALDKYPEKLSLAKLFGATHTVLVNEPSIISETIAQIKYQVEVVVDCTGHSAMIDIGMNSLRPGGRMILVGQPAFGEGIFLPQARAHYVGKTVLDSQGGLTNPTEDIPRYMSLYTNGGFNLSAMITHHYKLDQINDAITMMRSGRCGRIALEM